MISKMIDNIIITSYTIIIISIFTMGFNIMYEIYKTVNFIINKLKKNNINGKEIIIKLEKENELLRENIENNSFYIENMQLKKEIEVLNYKCSFFENELSLCYDKIKDISLYLSIH